MKIVFFGTSEFSAEILSFLHDLPCEIVAIVTRTDKPQGRSLKMGISPVKQVSLSLFPDIPLFQPEKASTDDFCHQLALLKPDLFFVVAYGEILKMNLLSVPKKACVNIHTSLLPKYRGAAPIQRCLMQGDLISGVTFMEMVLQMDAGDIFLQEQVVVSHEMNKIELERALLEAVKKRLPDFLLHFDEYYACKKKQKEEDVTIASKITSKDCIIDWNNSVLTLHNQVRALSPLPGAYVVIKIGDQEKRLKILKTIPHKDPHASCSLGSVEIQNNSLLIAAKDGFLELLEVQVEGKKAMRTEDFLRGTSKKISLVF